MIKINKPKFWDKKKISFFAILLYPFSLIIMFVVFLKKIFLEEKDFKIPIICMEIFTLVAPERPCFNYSSKRTDNQRYETSNIKKIL